jgi:putative transposase
MDEVFLTLTDEQDYLLRAVDQIVLCWISWCSASEKAAKKFFRKLLKDLTYAPHVIVSDKLNTPSEAKQSSQGD